MSFGNFVRDILFGEPGQGSGGTGVRTQDTGGTGVGGSGPLLFFLMLSKNPSR